METNFADIDFLDESPVLVDEPRLTQHVGCGVLKLKVMRKFDLSCFYIMIKSVMSHQSKEITLIR